MKKDPTRSTRRVAAARPLARELCSTIDASETTFRAGKKMFAMFVHQEPYGHAVVFKPAPG